MWASALPGWDLIRVVKNSAVQPTLWDFLQQGPCNCIFLPERMQLQNRTYCSFFKKNLRTSWKTQSQLAAAVVLEFWITPSLKRKKKTKLRLRQSDHAILTGEDMQCLKNRTQEPLTWLPWEPDHFLSAPSTWETKQLLALVTLAFDWLLFCSFTYTEYKKLTMLHLEKYDTWKLDIGNLQSLGAGRDSSTSPLNPKYWRNYKKSGFISQLLNRSISCTSELIDFFFFFFTFISTFTLGFVWKCLTKLHYNNHEYIYRR